MVELLMLVGGLVGVTIAADLVVEGAAGVARRWGVPELLVGMTICAFGTSAPELFVNAFAALDGRDGLVLGNVLGSNLFNTLAVLGLASLVAPLPIRASTRRFELPLTLAVLAGFLWLVSDGALGRGDALVLLAGFAGFVVYLVGLSGGGALAEESADGKAAIRRLAIGFVLLPVASRVVVVGATGLASQLGLSDALVGATLVAAGTSLPELATSLAAARQGRTDLAVGNVVGSNLFNLLLVLGVSALLNPLDQVGMGFALQALLLLGVTGAIWMATLRKAELNRRHGAVLLGAFAVTLGLLVLAG